MSTKMLTARGYYIPKYLHKRKIEIIRDKILKRKYGYLFYRKTISIILPSQANKHFFSRLKYNMFKRWESYWYTIRIEWKLILRAEIHYNLTLTYRMLRKWKYSVLLRKSSKIKNQIALMHFSKNGSRQMLVYFFCRWKWFMKYKSYKKYKKELANNFFKLKYKTEMLRTHFRRWIIYTKGSKKNGRRLLKATTHHDRKMEIRIFNKLKIYVNKKRERRFIIGQVQKLYENNLKFKAFSRFKIFSIESIRQNENMLLAAAHFSHQIKKKCFSKLVKNRFRNQSIRANLKIVEFRRNYRMKKRYFEILKLYHKQEIMKNKKMELSTAHFERKLKKNVIVIWGLFLNYRRDRMQRIQKIVNEIVHNMNINRAICLFTKWKNYTNYRLQKKLNMISAERFSNQQLLKQHFKGWREFMSFKTSKKLKIEKSCIFYKSLLLEKHLRVWKYFVVDEKKYREKLRQANQFCENRIINEALLLILKAGLSHKENTFKISSQKLTHQLFLSQKYLSKWKQKTLYKRDLNINESTGSLEECKENNVNYSNLEWYPICFLAPRYPKVLQN